MAFLPAMRLEELWIGEMRGVVIDGVPVVLVRLEDGVRAYEDRCAHQAVKMSEGRLAGEVLTCRAHEWSYDARSGAGLNPESARLRRVAVKVEAGEILVDVGGPGACP